MENGGWFWVIFFVTLSLLVLCGCSSCYKNPDNLHTHRYDVKSCMRINDKVKIVYAKDNKQLYNYYCPILWLDIVEDSVSYLEFNCYKEQPCDASAWNAIIHLTKDQIQNLTLGERMKIIEKRTLW